MNFEDFSSDELIMYIREAESTISRVKTWITQYYSIYTVNHQEALDHKAHELDTQLRVHHYAMTQKEKCIDILDKVHQEKFDE